MGASPQVAAGEGHWMRGSPLTDAAGGAHRVDITPMVVVVVGPVVVVVDVEGVAP